MKYTKIAAPIVASALALSVVACGGAQSATSAASSASAAATSAAATSAADSSSAAADSALEEAATVAAGAAAAQLEKELTILYWEGTLDNGASFIYMEDEAGAEGAVILNTTRDGKATIEVYSGKLTTADNGSVTIVDQESGKTFAFTIVDEGTDKGYNIDAGENGKGTLLPITEAEFEREIEKTEEAINTAVDNLTDEEVAQLLNGLGELVASADSSSAATSASASSASTAA